MNRFNVGDIVIINNTSQRGCVTKINSLLGENENVYEVKVGDSVRLYRELYLDLFMSKEDDDVKNKIINMDIFKFCQISDDDIIDRIIFDLDIHKSDDLLVLLANVCKVAKYLVEHQINIDTDIDFLNNSDLNSYVFSTILKRLNIDVLNVGFKTSGYDYYVANLVLIGDLYYYFDITAEQDLYMKVKDYGKLYLCSQGMGKTSYEKFFTPLGVIDLKNKIVIDNIPVNVAINDLDMDLINKMTS